MKLSRHWVPPLGILALVVLFLKLPEVPDLLGIFTCKTCTANDPYFQLVAAGYFATLVALSLLFPSFPNRQVARGGLTWSVLLALTLTSMRFPNWCIACLLAHSFHMLIWVIWLLIPPQTMHAERSNRKERIYLALFAPISVVALFSCLNLTFMAYGFKTHNQLLTNGLKQGESVPGFAVQTLEGRSISDADATRHSGIVINFISPNCPYCKEQLPLLNTVAAQLSGASYRFVNVSPALPSDLVELSPQSEWVEDKEGMLRDLFKVAGYPTLFVIDAEGQITDVIPGVPDQLETSLLTSLSGAQDFLKSL